MYHGIYQSKKRYVNHIFAYERQKQKTMKKFFYASQIHDIDRQTAENRGISSVELMEIASRAAADWIANKYKRRKMIVFAGPGNNGGDGLCIARILRDKGWPVDVHFYNGDHGQSAYNKINMERLANMDVFIDRNAENISIAKNAIIIDAIFGTGLNRRLEPLQASVVQQINASGCEVVSIDMPTGLRGEAIPEADECIVRATYTLTFQFPKLSMLMPETANYVGEWHIFDIGLSQAAIDSTESNLYYITPDIAKNMVHKRNRFSHKGTFGKMLLVAGSRGMMGAASLSAESALRTGLGLLTVATARCGYEIMQSTVREAMTLTSNSDNICAWSDEFGNRDIDAVAIGPGLGRTPEAQETLRRTLEAYGGKTPIVIDADGLFHLAAFLKDESFHLPENCILTPHVGELMRMTGERHTHRELIVAAADLAAKQNCIVVLKGAYSVTVLPNGRRVFNLGGNSGMATAGSGDVLTGIVGSLLAQGYSTEDAATLGVALHSLAGDIAAQEMGEEALLARDIINNIGKAYKKLKIEN